MPKLSLIMPAYNAEKTCMKAIESIISDKSDFELIIIDDGSKDNTFNICNEYAAKDARVKTYRKENGGVSSARNYGLNIANGEYVGFVDADDGVSEKYMQVLFPLMEKKFDVITFGYSGIINGEQVLASNPIITENVKEMYKDMLVYGGNLNSPWNKLFKRNLIHHTFNERKSMGEDLEFCCQYLKTIKTCKAISDELYIYNIDSTGSLTKHLDMVLDSITEDMKVLLDFVSSIGFDREIVSDKFYQRTEGVLGSVHNYKDFYGAMHYLLDDSNYKMLLSEFYPKKSKNKLLRSMLIKRKWKFLYIYLLCKRCARRVIRREG